MGRYSYDDMPPEGYRERREGGKRGTFIIAFVGILLTLIAIILYLLYTPHQAVEEDARDGARAVEVNVPEPEILSQTAVSSEAEEEITAEAEAVPAAEESVMTAEAEAEEAVQAEEADPAVSPAEEPAADVPVSEPAAVTVIVDEEIAASPVSEMAVHDYLVKEGDTLQSVAERYSVTPNTIYDYNDMRNPSLMPGEVLKIPQYSGTVYEMRPGDTLEEIVGGSGLSASDLAKLNGLASMDVQAGTKILIPEEGERIEGLMTFSSPVPGGEIRYFNGQYYEARGERIEGVVIASSPGTPVLSASSGEVTGTGRDASGRRFVEITHADGFVTRYTGLERVLAVSGQAADAGMIIGTIGMTSSYYGESAILFSISLDGINLNPEDYCRF